ncbi:MAG: hypothetical protein JNK65_01880, partial [Deltaproteobacteria bacterium]|nr:hypothetical protein [Deltaproteobacteria bacterium]
LGRVNALLTQQYELAKIEESKEDLSFQVIDKAIPQERESWPKKSILIPIGFLGGLFFSIFLAFFIDYLSKLKQKKPA